MKKPECLCDNIKGGHAIDCDLAPKDCYCLTHGFHTTNPKEQCPKCKSEAPQDKWKEDFNTEFIEKDTEEEEMRNGRIKSFISQLLSSQKEEIYREWKNKIEIAQNKWMPCKEKNCDNKKECETANHYIETIWNPTFKDLLK